MIPEIKDINDKSLMVIGKTARTSHDIISIFGLENPDFQKYTYIEDVDRIIYEGGLDVLKFGTEDQLNTQYAGVISDLIKYARGRSVWVASVSEIFNWFKNMHGLEVKTNLRSERRILLEVVNKESTPKSDFIVTLYFNREVDDVEVSSEIITTESPEFEFKPERNELILFFKSLEPNETRSYFIDFRNINV